MKAAGASAAPRRRSLMEHYRRNSKTDLYGDLGVLTAAAAAAAGGGGTSVNVIVAQVTARPSPLDVSPAVPSPVWFLPQTTHRRDDDKGHHPSHRRRSSGVGHLPRHRLMPVPATTTRPMPPKCRLLPMMSPSRSPPPARSSSWSASTCPSRYRSRLPWRSTWTGAWWYRDVGEGAGCHCDLDG